VTRPSASQPGRFRRPGAVLATASVAAAALAVFAVAIVKGASIREADEQTHRVVATVLAASSAGIDKVQYTLNGQHRTGVVTLAGVAVDRGDRVGLRVTRAGRLFPDSPWIPAAYTATALGLAILAAALWVRAVSAPRRRVPSRRRWLPYEITGRLRPRC
jgi:hypothetical protein